MVPSSTNLPPDFYDLSFPDPPLQNSVFHNRRSVPCSQFIRYALVLSALRSSSIQPFSFPCIYLNNSPSLHASPLLLSSSCCAEQVIAVFMSRRIINNALSVNQPSTVYGHPASTTGDPRLASSYCVHTQSVSDRRSTKYVLVYRDTAFSGGLQLFKLQLQHFLLGDLIDSL